MMINPLWIGFILAVCVFLFPEWLSEKISITIILTDNPCPPCTPWQKQQEQEVL
jgi:hypothetical protein